ncbi:BnaCnng16620D [Brassica napus]|nr:BnaCnng16620D [Brassica napus]
MSSSSSVSSGDERFSLVAKRTRQDSELNSSDEESNDESRPLKRLTRDATSPRSTAMMKSTLKIKRL